MLKKKTESAASFTPIRFGLRVYSRLSGAAAGPRGLAAIISPDNLVKQEDMAPAREEPVAVERGMISDREGRPLAVSVPVSAIWIDPQTTMEKGAVWAMDPALAGDGRKRCTSTSEAGPANRVIPTLAFSIWRVQINPEQGRVD